MWRRLNNCSRRPGLSTRRRVGDPSQLAVKGGDESLIWTNDERDEGMTMNDKVFLRNVEPNNLPIFYEHPLDSDATTVAAFPARDRVSFNSHWERNILGNRCDPGAYRFLKLSSRSSAPRSHSEAQRWLDPRLGKVWL